MKQRNLKIALLMVMCLIVTSITIFPKSASAGGKTLAFSNEDDQGTIQVNGGDYSNDCVIRHGSWVFIEYAVGVSYKEVHLQNNGTAWFIYNHKLCYYNYNIGNRAKETGIDAIQIYDDSTGSAYCYKTPSGEYYYLPSYTDLKNENYVTEKVADSDIPAEPTPTQSPSATSDPTSTKKPSTTAGDGASKTLGLSVKKSGNSVEVTEDGDVISKVTFNKKKGTATFQVKNKNKKVKKIKQAFIIGESYNYGYITKVNKFKTINRKTGKTKTYSGKWKKATIKKNVAVNVVKLGGNKKKKITGF